MTPEESLEKDRDILLASKEKGEADFEKNVTYISAGALGFSITFIEKLVDLSNSICLWILVLSWSLLTYTLLGNLYSHQLSIRNIDKTIDDLDYKNPATNENVKRRNKSLIRFNNSVTFSLFVGVVSMILFICLNLYNMKNNQSKPEIRIQPEKVIEEKAGRTITNVRPVVPQPAPKPSDKK